MKNELIRAEHLSKSYNGIPAVEDVSFSVREGEILGLLGESGCGKSTLAGMLLGVIKPDAGRILYYGSGEETENPSPARHGADISGPAENESGAEENTPGPAKLQHLSERAFRPYRRDLQMVLQNPFDCLDPRCEVGTLLEEPLKIWKIGTGRADRAERIRAMMAECGLPEDCLKKKPGEFSGGQLQRLAIARALLVQPRFLAADEIVSALDVPVQAQILELLLELKERHHLTVLFISHDLAVIRKISDRVLVMRQGRPVCSGAAKEVLRVGADAYVDALFRSGFPFSDKG